MGELATRLLQYSAAGSHQHILYACELMTKIHNIGLDWVLDLDWSWSRQGNQTQTRCTTSAV